MESSFVFMQVLLYLVVFFVTLAHYVHESIVERN